MNIRKRTTTILQDVYTIHICSWEGFVVESFKLLITYLNNEQLDKKNVINELYTFSLQKVLKPLAGKQILNNHTNLLKNL